MSIKNWPGGYIKPIPPTPAGPFQDGAAPGVWTLDQVAYWQKQGLWPTAGNVDTSNIGLFAGGSPDGDSTSVNTIDRILITTTGNATDFGDLTVTQRYLAACASTTRGIWAGNVTSPYNVISYVTISSAGNATDFGDLINDDFTSGAMAGCNSSTRGLFGGGFGPAKIEYITIATTGNSISFGNLTSARYGPASCSSSTRGVWASGSSGNNTIDYVTIATTGNAIDFGDMPTIGKRVYTSGCSSSTRGLFGGGTPDPGNGQQNAIIYITIATTGNALDFGDLSAPEDQWRNGPGACSSSTRGVWAGGDGPSNTINYVTITSLGNAVDFGDLTQARQALAGCSGGNGGVQ